MKRKHWLLLLTAVIVALALVIALLRFMAELQDYGRETSLESHDFNYVFDGSKSAKDIKLTKGSSVDQTIRFVPHWSSDDYLRLARTLTPSGLKFSDDDMIVVSTRSYDCAQPTRIDQMYFDWSVPNNQEPNKRLVLGIFIDAAIGNASGSWEIRRGEVSVSRANPRLDPLKIEAVVAAAYAVFAKEVDAQAVLTSPKCSIEAYVSSGGSQNWWVRFNSEIPKRNDAFIVNADTMIARRE